MVSNSLADWAKFVAQHLHPARGDRSVDLLDRFDDVDAGVSQYPADRLTSGQIRDREVDPGRLAALQVGGKLVEGWHRGEPDELFVVPLPVRHGLLDGVRVERRRAQRGVHRETQPV